MLDPVSIGAAFTAAQTAVKLIKQGINAGQDIAGLMGQFGAFFDAKDKLQKAANDNAKSGKSDTAMAMEIVMQAEQLRQQEDELKNLLTYGYGQPGLWDQLLLERSKIRQARERREREERAAAAKRRQQMQDLTIAVVGAIVVTAATVALAYFVFSVVMA